MAHNKPKDFRDIEFCDHCDTDTVHDIHESGHERDMSNDHRTCLVCGWRWFGLTGEYSPPYEE